MSDRNQKRTVLGTTRRYFLQGMAAGGVVVAAAVPRRAAAGLAPAATLGGSEFDLVIGEAEANFTGRTSLATVVNRSLPAPLLRWREGDTVTLRVRNELDADTSIHWHGILLPFAMDGVPGLSFNGIRPGETFTYRFAVRQSGTYWYHAHSGFQEQQGLYGPLIVEPREAPPFSFDREHVVLLSDWTDRDPLDLYRLLKRQPGYFNYNNRTLGRFVRDSQRDGFKTTLQERLEWGRMRMSPADLADVGGRGYTYLTNGVTPAGNWTGLFTPGERVLLRFINGSAMSVFDVRIPGLEMTVVAADGQNVEPVRVEEFRLSTAETLDVIVEPSGQDAYTIFAQSMDRAGFARGTLAVRDGLAAPVPELDPVEYLTMADMGHGEHASGHGAAAPAAESGGHEDHASHMTMPAGHADHAMHAAHESTPAGSEAHSGHEQHEAPAASAPAVDHADHAAPTATVDHSAHDAPAQAPAAPAPTDHSAHAAPATPAADGHAEHTTNEAMQTHPASESGNPGVDMQAMSPEPRLDDPGVGLRNNGRRVLTYADLKSVFPDPDGRPPERTIELHLTGHMERFVWSFDGIPFSGSEPIELRFGERVRIVLVNDTMMQHPIHLHGMWSDLENEAGEFQVRKHTISMPPGTKRSFRVTADAPGPWAFHCHLLYHMEAGMFRVVRVGGREEGGHGHDAHS